MRPRLGSEQRLFIAFALLVSTFGLASTLTLVHVRGIQQRSTQVTHYQHGVELGLELSSALRDQYAHQANTVILGNDSQLASYDGARRRVAEIVAQVRSYANTQDERAWVDDIANATDLLDHAFRDRIVPAMRTRDAASVREEDLRAQQLVALIQDRSQRLVDRFEGSIAELRVRVTALRATAFRWALLFLAAAPLLALMVGAYVHRSIARPVALLQVGATRITQGDLDARIEIDTPDEFGDLARQFNTMTSALKEHQQQLVQHEKLAAIGRLAAGVAHEINNPLAVILGYARLLERKATGQDAADLQVIRDESLRAKSIVGALLEMAHPSGIGRERVDLRALADEVIERLRAVRLLEGVTVSVTGDATVSGSAEGLSEVVHNLLKNACEAARPGGRVEVEIGAGAGFGSLVVRDTGQGLSHVALERVFEPFFSSKDRGTGLGLAACKGIVQAHGGTIEVANAPSGGARFEVRLPAASAEVA